MLIAITGTPGVGKSTVSKILAKDYKVIDIHSYAEEHGLFEEFDEEAGSYDVDVEKLNDSLKDQMNKDEVIFLDGHLSHFVDCDLIYVLRCDPKVICERLEKRGYDRKKILENVQTEVLDIILSESVDSGIRTYEIDCTDLNPEQVADKIKTTFNLSNDISLTPGKVDWTSEMDQWF